MIHNNQRNQDKKKTSRKVRGRLYTCGSHRTGDQHAAVRLHLKSVIDKTEMKSVFINAQIDIVDNIHNNLSESKRHDGKVIALQLQHRNGHQPAQKTCHQRSADDADQKHKRRSCNSVKIQRTCDNDRCKGAKRHKSSLTKIQLAGNTDVHVQTDRSHNITAHRNQKGRILPSQKAGGAHNAQRDIKCNDNRIGNRRIPVEVQFSFHLRPPLRLFH